MRALVIGYGSIGKRHVKNLLSFSNVEVIVCTKSADSDPVLKRCKVYRSLKECLEEKPDIGLITNVTSSHVPTAITLANHGIHLFIEKPLSNSMKGITTLLDLIRKKKLITMVGCNLRFHKCIQKIKNMILKKEIGKIISARVESGSYLPDWHTYEDYRNSYASQEHLGGGVVLTCIHEIDYMYWFFGVPKEVFSMTGKYSHLDLSVDDLSAILIQFKNTVIGEIHLDYFQRPDFRSCKIIGTKGTIYWDSDTNIVKMYDINKKKWIEKLRIRNYQRNTMYVDELSYFLKCVQQKNETMNNVYHGVKVLGIALDVKRSSKIKKVVQFGKR